jgi:hypothetical protein
MRLADPGYRRCLVGLTRAADQRLGRPAQRSSLPVVGVSPVCLMSGCLCGARAVASRQGQSRRRLVPRRAWAERMRVTGGGYRQVPLPDMRNAIAAARFVKLTRSAPADSHLQGLRSPGGDVGVVEGDLLTCCEPQPRVGRQASAATSTSGALPARNRPVKVSRGDGSPGRGPAGIPSGRYRGVDRIFLVQQPVFPEPALLDVLPAWPLAEAGKPVRLPVEGYRDIQPAPPPVLPAGASPGSAVLPGTMRLPPAAWVTATRRAWVFGDAGMVTCRTPSA